MPDNFDDDFMGELETTEAGPPPAAPSGGGQRIRASANMVSFGYHFRQFLRNAGLEMGLLLPVFLALRLLVGSGVLTAEARALADAATRIADGGFSLAGLPGAADPIALKASLSIGTTLPLSLVTLVSGGGETVLLLTTLAVSLGCLVLVYAIGRLLFAAEAGIAAALMLALMPGFAAAAGGLSTFSFSLLYFLGALLLYLQAARKNSMPLGLLAGGCAALAVFSTAAAFAWLPLFAVYALIEKNYRKPALWLTAGGAAGFLVLNLTAVIGFGATFGLPFTAFFQVHELPGSITGDLWLEAGEFFEVLLEHPLSLPYLFAALFAIGYTLRASRSNFSYLPMVMLVTSYTVFELFPVGFSPYRTITADAASILLLGPPVALLVGSFLAGLVNRQALRWGIGVPAACALPILIAYL